MVLSLDFCYKVEGGPGNARALDCGAGIGRITKHLLTKVTHRIAVVFVELSLT